MFTINQCVIYLVLYTYHKTLCFRIEFSMFEIENLSSSRMCVMDEMWSGFFSMLLLLLLLLLIFLSLLLFLSYDSFFYLKDSYVALKDQTEGREN